MIQVKITDSVGTIILNRPKRCNALTGEMIQQLSQALADLHQEKKVRGVILTGSGAHFCTGMDLKQWQQIQGSENALHQWYSDADALKTLIEQILWLPKPVVAAVDGAAMGSGLALVFACDLVVASQSATFSAASCKRGLVSGLVAPLACFRSGAALASGLLIGDQELSAVEAKDCGFVHHVVDSDKIWVRSKSWLETISQGAAESIQLTKRVLNEMIGEQLSSQLASGAAALATSLTTEAASEGLGAYVEKRPPSFPK
jgi:enoyl-CoA hydratase/carnithine racemase